MFDKGTGSTSTKIGLRGNIRNNCRPITCLPLVWNLLAGVMADEMHEYLERKIILPKD